MKNKPIVTGIIAVASPIPMASFTTIWCWIWCFGIGIGLLNYDTIPPWMLVVSLMPLLISPIFGLLGIIHSMIKIKTKKAGLALFLSVIGLLENFILLYEMYYVGTRF